MFDTQQGAGGEAMPRFAIFTDFDGTLVELADTPDSITLPQELGKEIAEAAQLVDGALAVISGRELSDLERYLPDGIAAAGGHGTERRRADGSRTSVDAGQQEVAAKIASPLQAFVEQHPGLLLELKNTSVALHYRQAPELREEARAAMAMALASAPEFEILDGKMVVEARPTSTGKAEAIRAFMQEAPFAGRVPVFLGDDVTDEDGFQAAQDMGGVGIKIGDGKTTARIRTPHVESARAIIIGLARRVAELTPETV